MKKLIIFIITIFFSFAYADGWTSQSVSQIFFESQRAPTATENDIQALFDQNNLNITNYRSEFWWFDESANIIYDYESGTSGNFIWGQRGYTAPSLAFSTFKPVIGTAYQLSTTRNVYLSCPVDIQVSSLLLGSASGTAYLDYADNNTFTTNLVTISQGTNATSGILNLINTSTITLTGIIPANKYMRERSVTNSGTATFIAESCQQVQL